jgi:hypothetical protein
MDNRDCLAHYPLCRRQNRLPRLFAARLLATSSFRDLEPKMSRLPTTDTSRPLLLNGAELRAFFRAREPIKQKCRPGEFYCLSCKAPKRPAFDIAQYTPFAPSRALLSGFCSTCDGPIYRAVNLTTIEQILGGLQVALPIPERRIGDISPALSNADWSCPALMDGLGLRRAWLADRADRRDWSSAMSRASSTTRVFRSPEKAHPTIRRDQASRTTAR